MVGARDASEEDIEFAKRVAAVCANQGITVISGGARGVDLESMVQPSTVEAALWGSCRIVRSQRRIGPVPGGSDSGPVGACLSVRSGCALVCLYRHGAEQIDLCFERRGIGCRCGGGERGNMGVRPEALEAAVWLCMSSWLKTSNLATTSSWFAEPGEFPPEPWDDLRSLFVTLAPEPTLFNAVREVPVEQGPAPSPALAEAPPAIPLAWRRGGGARPRRVHLCAALPPQGKTPTTEQAVGQALGLVPAQAKAWLKRARHEGVVRKLGRPVRYAAVQTPPSLFSGPEEEVPLSRRV